MHLLAESRQFPIKIHYPRSQTKLPKALHITNLIGSLDGAVSTLLIAQALTILLVYILISRALNLFHFEQS